MPIPSLNDETPINQYVATAGQTAFDFTFYIFETSDIKVYVNDILETIITDYNVRKSDGGAIGSGDLPMDGGKIVFNIGLNVGDKVSINRDIPVNRLTSFTSAGPFTAEVVNKELTRILAISQQLKRDIIRSLKLAPSDAEGGELNLPTDRADSILAFDLSNNLIVKKFADIDRTLVSPYMATLLDDTTASQARTTLDAQQLNANLTTLAGLAGVSNLSALAGLTGASNKIPYFTGAGAMALTDVINPATTSSRGITFLNNPITIANNATTPNTDIDFSGGVFQFSDGSGQAVASALTKRLQSSGSWSAGAGGNMLMSGARANSSTYHLYAIHNPTTGASDYGALLGVAGTAPDPTSVLPSGYTKFRRVGSILTDGSGNIRAGQFIYLGSGSGYYFEFSSPSLDVNATNQGTSAVNYAIPVPLGIPIVAFMNASVVRGGNAVSMYLSNPNTTDLAPSTSIAPLGQIYLGSNDVDRMQTLEISTNTSGQIRTRWSASDASINMKLSTTKFFDRI